MRLGRAVGGSGLSLRPQTMPSWEAELGKGGGGGGGRGTLS